MEKEISEGITVKSGEFDFYILKTGQNFKAVLCQSVQSQ
jgi:hypothetical protein